MIFELQQPLGRVWIVIFEPQQPSGRAQAAFFDLEPPLRLVWPKKCWVFSPNLMLE